MDGEKEVTCNVDIKPLASGEYILTHAVFLDDERNYLLVTSEIIIKIEFPPLSIEEQDKNQTIENFSNLLVVKVSDEFYDDYCPTLYYDKNDKTKSISNCNIINGIANYKLLSEIPNGSYEIYYKTPCSTDLSTTGINLTLNIESIDVSNISFSNGATCTTSEVNEIIISTEKEPVGLIYNAILFNAETKKQYQFNTCTTSGSTITCSNPSVKIIGGEYSLYKVNRYLRYNISAVTSTLNVDRLGFQFVKLQLYHNTAATFFNVWLASEKNDIPEIFLSSDGTNMNKVNCQRDTNDGLILKCDLNDTIMTQDENEVFYQNKCRNYVSTEIIVKKVADSNKIIHVTGLTEGVEFSSFSVDLLNDIPSNLINDGRTIEVKLKIVKFYKKLYAVEKYFLGIKK